MNPYLLLCPSFFKICTKKWPQFTLFPNLPVFSISLLILMAISSNPIHGQDPIHLGTLLDEMTNLERLTTLPSKAYRVVQYSSYDRRSQKAGMKGWFSNSDGFGGEPIAGFQEIIQQPDDAGSGRYLICDVAGPGTILRLWTAGINGNIRLFLDDMEDPIYEGNAEEFFWNTASRISGLENNLTSPEIFRQFDATYFPVPFSKRCRIEWIGNIDKIHFYHVGIRLYDQNVKIKCFVPEDITENSDKILKIRNTLLSLKSQNKELGSEADSIFQTIPGNTAMQILEAKGSKAIDILSLELKAEHLEMALRTNILKIYFDDAQIPQVCAPIGDFFGAAPGLNPYISYPLSVNPDGRMTCRFIMPFRNTAKIMIENMLDREVEITGHVHFRDYQWTEGKSMHFRTRWKMSHELTASNTNIIDVPYVHFGGSGRIVGTAAFIYNPSQAVTSWGNWWGEGDEKIFIDNEQFPSFFGTGSEDYFNYSWSSEQFFSFPYCGQPRNDGPGNRGYVSNFRWHILDDLLFMNNISFYMELLHHGQVPHFSYGRIVYAYALPGCFDDFQPISKQDVYPIPYLEWNPVAYLGSSGFYFIEAEDIAVNSTNMKVVDGNFWSGGKILLWEPVKDDEELRFIFRREKEGKTNLGLTFAHQPDGGNVMVYLNGEQVAFNDNKSIELKDTLRTYLRNYISSPLPVKAGNNEITIQCNKRECGNTIGLDFIWLNER